MRRNNVIKFSLVLSVALVIGVTAPHFDPGARRAAQYRSSDYQRFLTENMPWSLHTLYLRRYRTRSKMPLGTVRFGYPSRP